MGGVLKLGQAFGVEEQRRHRFRPPPTVAFGQAHHEVHDADLAVPPETHTFERYPHLDSEGKKIYKIELLWWSAGLTRELATWEAHSG